MSDESYSLPDDAQFEHQLIEDAKRGDAEAGKLILKSITQRIDNRNYDSPLFPYLAESLWEYLDGMRLDRALNVEAVNPGGAPAYDRIAIAAVDILLRDYAGYNRQAALTWIVDNIECSIDTARRSRRECDSRHNKNADKPLMERLDKEMLLHLSRDYRQKVAEVLPHT